MGEGTAVVDPDDHGAAVGFVDDLQPRAERQGAVGRRHVAGIEALAAGRLAPWNPGPYQDAVPRWNALPASIFGCEIDPVIEGSLDAVVLQAATKSSGIIADARVRIFFKDGLPCRCACKSS